LQEITKIEKPAAAKVRAPSDRQHTISLRAGRSKRPELRDKIMQVAGYDHSVDDSETKISGSTPVKHCSLIRKGIPNVSVTILQ